MPDIFRAILTDRTTRHVGDVSVGQNSSAWNQPKQCSPTKYFDLPRHIQLPQAFPNFSAAHTAPLEGHHSLPKPPFPFTMISGFNREDAISVVVPGNKIFPPWCDWNL